MEDEKRRRIETYANEMAAELAALRTIVEFFMLNFFAAMPDQKGVEFLRHIRDTTLQNLGTDVAEADNASDKQHAQRIEAKARSTFDYMQKLMAELKAHRGSAAKN